MLGNNKSYVDVLHWWSITLYLNMTTSLLFCRRNSIWLSVYDSDMSNFSIFINEKCLDDQLFSVRFWCGMAMIAASHMTQTNMVDVVCPYFIITYLFNGFDVCSPSDVRPTQTVWDIRQSLIVCLADSIYDHTNICAPFIPFDQQRSKHQRLICWMKGKCLKVQMYYYWYILCLNHHTRLFSSWPTKLTTESCPWQNTSLYQNPICKLYPKVLSPLLFQMH